jgi:tetratricopeptide (TPR) repeat protein
LQTRARPTARRGGAAQRDGLGASVARPRRGCGRELSGALAFWPDYPQAHHNIGTALLTSGQVEGAIAEFREALRLRPDYALAQCGLGNALTEHGRAAEAIGHYLEAARLEPNLATAHYGLALAYLIEGELTEGFHEYEWRWRLNSHALPPRNFRQPLWRGEDIADRVLLLHAEQGIGDTLQFARYVRPAAARCSKAIVEVQPELARLLRAALDAPNIVVVERSATFPGADNLPPFDLHCPLLSLPAAFGTTLKTIPADIPYLVADPKATAAWARRLDGLVRPRIGLAWSGNTMLVRDRARSIEPDALAPLAGLANVSFVSLQKPDGGVPPVAPPGMRLHDFTAEVGDFADTAALICALDLAISVDTAVAHLAARSAVWCGCSIASTPTGAGCSGATTPRGIRRCGSSGNRRPEIGTASSSRSDGAWKTQGTGPMNYCGG